MKIRLTKKEVEKTTTTPKGGRREYTFQGFSGLKLRVSLNQGRLARVWLYRLPGNTRGRGGVTLGVYPGSPNARAHRELPCRARDGSGVDIEAAYYEASAKARVVKGRDARIAALEAELAELRKQSTVDVTLEELIDKYQSFRPRSPVTRLQNEQLARKHLGDLLTTSAAALAEDDLAARLYQVAESVPHSAGTLAALLRAAYRHGCNRRLIYNNPAANLRRPVPATIRQRSLRRPELAAFMSHLQLATGRTIIDAVWVSLASLQRCANVAAMEWREIDADARTWTIPSHKLKGVDRDRDHVVHLGSIALDAVLRQGSKSSFVFHGAGRKGHLTKGALSKAVRMISKKMLSGGEIRSRFTLHDLRRTASTHLVEDGFSTLVTDSMQAHALGVSRVTQTYVATILPEDIHRAWLRWDEILRDLR